MTELLAVEGLTAGYGEAVVLRDLSFTLEEGRSLALLGRNGVGKTTLLNTLMGLTTRMRGEIRLARRDIARLSPERRAAAGLGWVPQERDIFVSLTVEENLIAVARPGPWDAARVFALFPRLKDRRRNLGSQLSGGEQQMLSVGRALVLNPRVLLLDEPLEGLAPVVVDELLTAFRRIVTEEGLSTLVVEQKARKVLGFVDEALVMARGAIVHRAPARALLDDPAALDAHLGVAERGA